MLSFNLITISFLASIVVARMPQIYSPGVGDELIRGQNATITWDNTCRNDCDSSLTATLKLGWLNEGSDDQHLFIELAPSVTLATGHAIVLIPDGLTYRESYIVALIATDASQSQEFIIDSASSQGDEQNRGARRSINL